MSVTVPRRRRHPDAPFPVPLIVAASLLAAGTIALIWLVAVPWGPLVCPAIDPAPRNCFASDRAGTAVVATITVCLVYLATLTAALFGGRRRRAWTLTGVVVLAVAPIACYLSIAWLPGFAL